jgi:hypothetical protein
MGNRMALTFSNCCEFEANDCLPITWLVLFSSQEFLIETRQEDGEEYEVTLYRTNRDTALKRVNQVINSLKGRTPAWAFLQPIEILKDELNFCSSAELIELDATQFWVIDESFQRKIANAATAFQEIVGDFVGNSEHDIPLVTQLVNEYSLETISSITEIDSEERMFILIGTYWGDPEREKLYSFDYFGDKYWRSES